MSENGVFYFAIYTISSYFFHLLALALCLAMCVCDSFATLLCLFRLKRFILPLPPAHYVCVCRCATLH